MVQIDADVICRTWKSILTALGGVFNGNHQHQHEQTQDGKIHSPQRQNNANTHAQGREETTPGQHNVNVISSTRSSTADNTSTAGGNDAAVTKRATEVSRNRLADSVSRLQSAAAVADEVESMSMVSMNVSTTLTAAAVSAKALSRPYNSSTSNSEVESLDDDGINEDHHHKNSNNDHELVSILPAGYDQSLALSVTSSSRDRAFHLLDLASVISSHRRFHSLTAGAGVFSKSRTHAEMRLRAAAKATMSKSRTAASTESTGGAAAAVYIRPEFAVMKNRDPQLLRLLVKLGVGLRCAGAKDVTAARDAVRRAQESDSLNNDTTSNDEELPTASFLRNGMDPPLVDDVGKARKPDGYLRRFVSLGVQRSSLLDQRQPELAVDGPEEVARMSNAIHRFSARAGSAITNAEGIGLSFILVLPSVHVEDDDAYHHWDDLLRSVADAAEVSGGMLAGVSVDMSSWKGRDNHDDKSKLKSICTSLRRLRVILCTRGQQKVRIDLRGLPYPLGRAQAGTLTSALANIVDGPIMKEEAGIAITTEKNEASNQDNAEAAPFGDGDIVFTADVSQQLVAHAGALCARIIGVRRGEDTTQYYIDDGCYGSLCSTLVSCQSDSGGSAMSNGFLPVPLYGDGSTHKKMMETVKVKAVQATVWGPTCDGLDRVCESVTLPNDLETNRDWLIFPHLGCGGFGGGLGLGTAFNGFDPPDTAYCVLGYFGGRSTD